MNKRELAENYFKEGYNCTQAVVLAFSEEINVDKKSLLMLASAFGGGMGRLREVCGAVSGMFIVLGFLEGYYDPLDKTAKTALYSKVQNLAKEFKDINGSIVCKELLSITEKTLSPVPDDRTKEYYKKRPCVSLVGDAAEILDNYLKNK